MNHRNDMTRQYGDCYETSLVTKPGLPGVVTALRLSLSLLQRFPVSESHQVEDGIETEG